MRGLWLVCLFGALFCPEAKAWVEVEDDYGNAWDCDGEYCYRDVTVGERMDMEFAKDSKEDSGSKMTGDPLAMPKPKANKKAAANSKSNTDKDPLAMPAKNQNRNDPLAF